MTEKIESKIELTERLRREGRDKEALQYREQIREQLRAEGKTRKEAKEGAWEAAHLAFPPLPSSEQDTPAIATSTDEIEDENWVLRWFMPVHSIAAWKEKHGIDLTDAALSELLQKMGVDLAWAWLLGARGDRPPSVEQLTSGTLPKVASLIEGVFEKAAELLTVEDLEMLRPKDVSKST
jgi:hypothetical protein